MRPRIFILLLLAAFEACASAFAESVALGVVYKDTTTSGELTLRNPGKSSVRVIAIDVSCDCLTVSFAPMEIPAGDVRRVGFAYRSSNTGAISVEVKFLGLDGKQVVQHDTVSGFVADKGWLLPVSDLLNRPADDVVTVVDTRRSDRFALRHMPRALNLPAFAIKSRLQLKSQKLVLVDEGYSPRLLLEEVKTLRGFGFEQVYVLEGGLAAWIRLGGAVEGPDVTALSVTSVSPAEVARTNDRSEWRIVAVEGPAAVTAGDDTIVRLAHWEAVGSLFAEPRDNSPSRSAPRVLVIAPNAATYARIEERFGRAQSSTLYYLSGGFAAWDEFRAFQSALNPVPPQFTQAPSSRGLAPSSAGCGSCGKK